MFLYFKNIVYKFKSFLANLLRFKFTRKFLNFKCKRNENESLNLDCHYDFLNQQIKSYQHVQNAVEIFWQWI